MTRAFYIADPLAYEIEPGTTVGDLKTKEECQQAIYLLEHQRDAIMKQIAEDEARLPHERRAGWRTKAGSALRWKKRIMAAVRVHSSKIEKAQRPAGSRAQAILDTIREELGPRDFDRMVDLAKASRPDIFGEEAFGGAGSGP